MTKAVSRWANQHTRLAITLLIGCELTNGFGGVLLGANALNNLPGATLLLLGVLAAGLAIGVRSPAAARIVGHTYAAQRWRLAVAFGSNWLLWIVLGAYWSYSVQTAAPSGTAWGSRRVVVRSDTLINPADTTIRPPVVYAKAAQKSEKRNQYVGKRIGFFLLFLLGFATWYFSIALACTMACSGYGALAALTLSLGLGFLAGGGYFLGRALESPFVPLRERPLPQRRRALRRFWLLWLILIGTFGVSLLTCSR
ncbi:hypothetical protein [Spirosoma rhododendri]|uniref:Uncharacterized protein n=1 Tax=Spirosoma rhododendri TaxID=2728024 RepID=A0A7L5DGK2_9BACT|nr:hypothetical protein [Spirosoma rhododendri]QJD77376.1 hypothetical protein HH216_02280 [Spirosoma rhododendri]